MNAASNPQNKPNTKQREFTLRYTKDLTLSTTIRMSPSLRAQSEKAADAMGISFSDFCRQSLTRNIHVARAIEDEVVLRMTKLAKGENI